MKRATRLLYLLAVLPALALPADAQVQVSEEHTSKATDSSPAGYEWTQHRFTLNNGLLRYTLGYQASSPRRATWACPDPAAPTGTAAAS